MNSPLLHLAGIDKSFGPVRVLRDVGFSVDAGQVLGIVGENGSGKSTTMNILSGVLAPDAGEMRLAGEAYAPASRREAERAGVGFIQQELNIFPNLSVAENLLLGRAPKLHRALPLIAGRRRRALARRWLETVGLDVDPDWPAGRLSAGQRQLLEIARALSSEARVLIFDEPTTSLTAREIDHLFALIERLRAEGRAILFISHALDDVLMLADRIIVLRDGAVTLDAPASGLTSGALVTAMIGREVDALFPDRPPRRPASEPVLRVEGLGEPRILADIGFTVDPGEIVGVAGLMGAGRTELARMLFGLDRHRDGTVRLDGTPLRSGDLPARLAAGMAFLTEDRRIEGLMPEASVADNIMLAAAPHYARHAMLDRREMARAATRTARMLKIKSGPLDRAPIATLSGGNQQKALLGRWLLCNPRLLILDEPTRGVDIGARQDIYRQVADLAAQGAGVLVISSEIEEVMGLADRILVLHRGRLAGTFAREAFDREVLLAAAFGQGGAA